MGGVFLKFLHNFPGFGVVEILQLPSVDSTALTEHMNMYILFSQIVMKAESRDELGSSLTKYYEKFVG